MTSAGWVPVPEGSDFPLANLPYGVFSRGDEPPRVGVAIGDHVLDVAAAGGDLNVFAQPTLNPFLAAGRPVWTRTRDWLVRLLTDEAHRARVEPALLPRDSVRLHLPFAVADYVDCYSSLEHATNLGRLFRPDAEPLLPNWRHLPVAYHGRAGTVVVSGTPIVRPSGQRPPVPGAAPAYGPSLRLDIEAEVGFVVGPPSRLGTPVATAEFRDRVLGLVLVNDWSARDIQAFEYQPLGPFLGKSFATTVSPWVVPLAALEAARVAPPAQDPAPLPYLQVGEDWGLDLTLEVELQGTVVSRPPFAGMYWTMPQQLAQVTANGASLRTGDLVASGTVSGPEPDQRGSLIELSWGGRSPLALADGSTRSFLQDGDTVVLRAGAPAVGGGRLGFGECAGTVCPAAG